MPSASSSLLGALYGRGSGINGTKSCILGLSWHLISLLKLHFFVLFFSYFQQLFKIKDPFYYFWLYCGSDSGTSICWLQRCIKIVFLQCNLTWKTEQLTNYKCSLIQYGDENDSEVLLYRRNVYYFVKRHSELIAIFLKKIRKKTEKCPSPSTISSPMSGK